MPASVYTICMNLLLAHIELCKIAGNADSLKNRILCAVAGEKQITQSQLCETCCIKKSNVASLCKSLEKEKLIKRTKNGKFVHICITPAGEKKLEETCAKINKEEYMKIIGSIKL